MSEEGGAAEEEDEEEGHEDGDAAGYQSEILKGRVAEIMEEGQYLQMTCSPAMMVVGLHLLVVREGKVEVG